MPQAIPTAAAAFGKWVAGIALGAGASAPAAAYIAAAAYVGATAGIYTAVQVGLGALAQAQIPDVETQKSTRKQTRPLRQFALGGISRMSGPFMLRETKGSKLALVIACCEGRLGEVSQIYLNDDKVTIVGGFVQGMPNERYGGGDLIRLDYRLGLATETHYGFLTPDFGSYWPTTARGDGIASIGLLAQHRSVESFPRHFPNGEPIPSMAAAPVCYDWRDPAQDREDESTWEVCWNPVVWLVHVEWARHGRSWERCIAPVLDALTDEADYCDETVDGEARYRLAGNYPANLTPDAVRGNILATMDGWMSIGGKGELIVKAGRYQAPTFTLTGEHIVGYSWRAFQVAEEAVNELTVSYTSAAHDYSEVEAGLYAKPDPHPLGKSEDLKLPWVPSPKQAMRLAARKMTRLDAQRRGQIRTTIFGLNGLGQRYIRVQNPELASMADVVVEVMNVEVDFARAEVVFDVILADPDIDDDDPADEVGPVEPRPPVVRPHVDPATRPTGRDTLYPTDGNDTEITVVSFGAVLPDGYEIAVTGDTITGLTPSTIYGVFWREDVGLEVEAYPATDHMATGSWVFIGWQATHDGSGVYPGSGTLPGGWAGSGEAPAPDVVGSDYVDGAVTVLRDDLLDGTVIPAEAATFTGKGALAEKDDVATADVVPRAISDGASAFTEANLGWSGSGYNVAQQVTLETTGGAVSVVASLIMTGSSTAPFLGQVQIERDGTIIWGPYTVAPSHPETSFTDYEMLQPFSLQLPDAPAAGTHTWTLKFSFVGAGGGGRAVRSRFLEVQERKTET